MSEKTKQDLKVEVYAHSQKIKGSFTTKSVTMKGLDPRLHEYVKSVASDELTIAYVLNYLISCAMEKLQRRRVKVTDKNLDEFVHCRTGSLEIWLFSDICG